MQRAGHSPWHMLSPHKAIAIGCLQRELSFFSLWENLSTLTFPLKITFHVPYVIKRLLCLLSHPHSLWMAGWMTVKWGRRESTLNKAARSQCLRGGEVSLPTGAVSLGLPGSSPCGCGHGAQLTQAAGNCLLIGRGAADAKWGLMFAQAISMATGKSTGRTFLKL